MSLHPPEFQPSKKFLSFDLDDTLTHPNLIKKLLRMLTIEKFCI